jgi:hypothetical protein
MSSSKDEVKITKAEAKRMEDLAALYNSPSRMLGCMQDPQQVWKEYIALWDSLGEKYGFEPRNYTYKNGEGRFVKSL